MLVLKRYSQESRSVHTFMPDTIKKKLFNQSGTLNESLIRIKFRLYLDGSGIHIAS